MNNNIRVKIIGNEPRQRKDNHKTRWPKSPPKNGATNVEYGHQLLSFTVTRSIRTRKKNNNDISTKTSSRNKDSDGQGNLSIYE